MIIAGGAQFVGGSAVRQVGELGEHLRLDAVGDAHGVRWWTLFPALLGCRAEPKKQSHPPRLETAENSVSA